MKTNVSNAIDKIELEKTKCLKLANEIEYEYERCKDVDKKRAILAIGNHNKELIKFFDELLELLK